MWFGRVQLSMDPYSDGRYWRVDSWLTYGGYEVAPGFMTDGASIPRLLWRVIGCPLRADYTPAAVLHDYLYKEGITTRKEADKTFYDAMLCSGVNRFKAWTIYAGVRLGGWVAWNGHRKSEVDSI